MIDQQVRETASVLIDSEIAGLRKIDFEQADEIISEELGESRIGKFFVLRNSQGETIYESASARLLPVAELPREAKWFELTVNGKYLRGLNLALPRIPDRTLQVGLVLDEALVHPSLFSSSTLSFFGAVLVIGLVVSLLLTSFLLKPVARLEGFLSSQAQGREGPSRLSEVPAGVFGSPKPDSSDEFERLVAGLNRLIGRVNRSHDLSRLWAYQMAHELKTPLSRLQIQIEKLESGGEGLKISPHLDRESRRISETINSFLSWAELENSTQRRHLFMNKASEKLQDVIQSEDLSHRIQLEVEQDCLIPASPHHLEQLFRNLVGNALKHTSSDVKVKLAGRTLFVEDQGQGLPEKVLKRIGEPFNRGESLQPGHGLGLAWVGSVCRHYEWNWAVESCEPKGTRIRVDFTGH